MHGPDYAGGEHHALSCQHCHGGQPDRTFETMAEAHTDMVADPSVPGQSGCLQCHSEEEHGSACDKCHPAIFDATANSLHTNLWGEKKAIEDRCGCTFEGSDFEGYFDNKCGGCHTTCGQCHISRPNSVGGGFPKIGSYYSHRFRRSPDMNEQCTACHGSRVGIDYKGEIEGNVPDVHRSAGKKCEFCHDAEEIHGDNQYSGEHYDHRYEVATMPRCEECHTLSGLGNKYHVHHTGMDVDCGMCHADPGYTLATMQCQVCHSQPYKNCTNCHNLVDDPMPVKFDIDPSVIQLKIANNPSPHRSEYDISLVRHTPIDPNTYADWGLPLPQYNDKPTWQYTSPHNILASTPQTTVEAGQSCSISCHQSADGPSGFLLRESDLYEADGVTRLPDYDANIDIVIPETFPNAK